MLRRASNFFAPADADDVEAKEARERQKRAQRLQQRRSQTVQGASRLLPRSPQSTSFSMFDNAPPVASGATEFDREYETKGKGRRQLNPMGEAKQRETEAEEDRIDRLAEIRGINRAQAKVLLAQNPGIKLTPKTALEAPRPKSFAGTQSYAGQPMYAPQPRYATASSTRPSYVASPPLQASSQTASPQSFHDAASSPVQRSHAGPSSPRSINRGSPAQQLVRSASEESITIAPPAPVTPPARIVSTASPSLPVLDFSSPRTAPTPPSLLRKEVSDSPALSLSAFGLNKSPASSINETSSANYSFSSHGVPSSRYGLGVALPPAQVITVGGGLPDEHVQPYNESMIYDAVARAR
ncbi:hypothetical protein BCR37DRAFT_247166 [Protomyces lactucae-debilis]|uniref:Uncharacterized protein n=1 Tax=Protomyces lactucae-debilis TaxID=2754530 RepID=A0A1Y2FPY5_PROLT|nr:uncharacterized protein BCR37DRAFT_247166 [Protomyces lactucae-debilis]ORY85667.1 hypothetical protein BCR37DRAFT_247166 [Protomyces lactucae-debilis]